MCRVSACYRFVMQGLVCLRSGPQGGGVLRTTVVAGGWWSLHVVGATAVGGNNWWSVAGNRSV